MKGFLSLLLVLMFALILLALYSSYHNLMTKQDKIATELLLFEVYGAREVELKRAITTTIEYESRAAMEEEAERILGRPPTSYERFRSVTGVEVAAALGYKLKKLESREGDYKDNFGIDVDFWCGTITREEQVNLPREMLETNNTKKCSNCWDFDFSPTVGVPTTCTKFLLVILDPAEPTTMIYDPTILTTGKVVFGVSILDKQNRIASIATIPAGSRVRW
jgi:hypothetical protein